MFDPWQSFKSLPWIPLISTAVVTVTLGKIFDLVFISTYSYVPQSQSWIDLIFSPPWGLILIILLSIGLGAVSVWLLETFFSPGAIYASTLWGLVLCLLVLMIIVSLISDFANVPSSLLGINQNILVGMVVGVFWKGKKYWRW